MSKTHRIGVLGVLVLVALLGLLLAAGPASAAWPMWGDPPMPFGGQAPTVWQSAPIGDPFSDPLDLGEYIYDSPHPGELLNLGWTFVGKVNSATGPWADRIQNVYILFRWNLIYREFAQQWGYTANTHWGTLIETSVDPNDYWPKLPPKATWLWTGPFQGVTFLPATLGLHSIQGTMVGCNKNLGLKAYYTWFFIDPYDSHGQAWVVRTFGR